MVKNTSEKSLYRNFFFKYNNRSERTEQLWSRQSITLWYGVWVDITELDGMKVLNCSNTHCYSVAHGLVKRRVRSCSKQTRQVAVLHEVLDVSHLVVDRLKILRVHLSAHLDP